MPDKYDPYREALVMETVTVWPDDYDHLEPTQRQRIEKLVHETPEEAANLQYIRSHTGFCRQITITPEDLERLQS